MGERSKLDQNDMHPLFCPVYVLDRRMQEVSSPPKWTKHTTQKVYVGHLHHYSKWDPKTKLVSPQFHVMFNDNFDTVQAPDPNVKITDTMDRLFKTNKCKYNDQFVNNQTYLFSHGGVDIHPDNFSPNLEICKESMTMTFTYDDMNYREYILKLQQKTASNDSNDGGWTQVGDRGQGLRGTKETNSTQKASGNKDGKQ
jgi:hypothetical protein